MKRKTYMKDMGKTKAQNHEESEQNKNTQQENTFDRVTDSTSIKNMDQKNQENSDHRPKRGALPNVKVLMKGYSQMEEEEEEEEESEDENPVNDNESDNDDDEGNMNINCEENNDDAARTENGPQLKMEANAENWQHDSQQNDQEDRKAFLYTMHGNNEEYKVRFQSSIIRNQGGKDFSSETLTEMSAVTPVSAHVSREMLHQKVEKASFADHGSFADHPHDSMASSARGHHLQPLTPVIVGRTGHFKSEDGGVSSNSPENYSSYHNGENAAWEQENNRYANYSWKNPDNSYPGEGFANGSISLSNTHNNNNNDNNIVNNNNIIFDSNDNSINSYSFGGNDITPDRFDQAYYSDDPCGKIAVSNGRRRRKRVQTPVQRTAANMRERRRMCHLNVAFDRLKDHLPNVKDKRKLSRIQTLKAAIYYIHVLRDSLNLC